MDNRGYSALGLGQTGHFWDGSEKYWEPTIDAVDTIWNTYETIPVNRNRYLPDDVNLIAENKRSYYQSNNPKQLTEGDDYFSTFGFDPKSASGNAGIYRDPYDSGSSKIFDDKLDRPTLALSDSAVKQMRPVGELDSERLQPFASIGTHELTHYWDDAIVGQNQSTASKIMDSFKKYLEFSGEEVTQEKLQDMWMNDPRTKHLNLNDPNNTGLRTLLRNRSHHGGVVNPREGFGEYLSTAMTDDDYKTTAVRRNPEKKDYYLSPSETFARAGGPLMRPQRYDEGFSNNTRNLNKTFADSMATFLNSR